MSRTKTLKHQKTNRDKSTLIFNKNKKQSKHEQSKDFRRLGCFLKIEINALDRIRTCNLAIMSRALYR